MSRSNPADKPYKLLQRQAPLTQVLVEVERTKDGRTLVRCHSPQYHIRRWRTPKKRNGVIEGWRNSRVERVLRQAQP